MSNQPLILVKQKTSSLHTAVMLNQYPPEVYLNPPVVYPNPPAVLLNQHPAQTMLINTSAGVGIVYIRPSNGSSSSYSSTQALIEDRRRKNFYKDDPFGPYR